jgi:hypothetical protein
MIVGIVTGTYSSIFVAAAIVTFWRRKQLRTANAPAPAAVSSQSANGAAPSSKRAKQRKVRAS